MTNSPNSTSLSRRWFLKSAAIMSASAVAITATPAPSLTWPLTPAEYLSQMQAIGWRAVAACHGDRAVHVIEYGPDAAQHHRESLPGFRSIQSRVHNSGPDFWKRTSAYLYDLGLIEDVLRPISAA